MTTVPVSLTIARYAREYAERGVPGQVEQKVATHLLDTIGVQLAASRQDFALAIRSVVRALGGRGDSVALGLSDRVAAPNAALLNGTLAHGVDYDDTHLQSIVHPSSTVVPAALAVAEEVEAGGAELAAALALGLETAVRIGLAAEGEFHDRGLHATPIAGVFGATVSAGMLYGLESERLVSALGLAASMAGGLLEFLTDGTSAKRLHGGWAAHGGVLAARLGGSGFSGPAGGLDGRFGLLRALFRGSANSDRIVEGLGDRWEMMDTALKPYPSCHFVHAFLDIAAQLREEIGFASGRTATDDELDRIDRIECGVVPLTIPVVCEPEESKVRPQTPYDAQFSLHFSVALMLAYGRVTLDEYAPATIREPRLISLASRVRIIEESRDEFPSTFPGRMRIVLGDGRIFEGDRSINRGGPGAPLSAEDVGEKFRANAAPSLGEEVTQRILQAMSTSALPSARRIMEEVRAPLARACGGEGL